MMMMTSMLMLCLRFSCGVSGVVVVVGVDVDVFVGVVVNVAVDVVMWCVVY